MNDTSQLSSVLTAEQIDFICEVRALTLIHFAVCYKLRRIKQTSCKMSSGKDLNYLSWDDYFMSLAYVASQRSKDPCTKVGACIASPERRVIALGYNGMPNGCDDDDMPWGKNCAWEESKYPFVCHAEMNAIMNKSSIDLRNCAIYTTLFPCNECSKLIIQSGISRVVYLRDKNHDTLAAVTSRRLLTAAMVEFRQHVPEKNLTIDFSDAQQTSAKSVGDSKLESLKIGD